ncbi:MAG: hypothetical protein JWN87_1512 [Frankiales bacterium]|nr:hypothetical protein [Frankiales bacterium]
MPLSRRDLVRTATVTAAATVASPLLAESAAAATSTTWVVPLLERATYGATPTTIAQAKALKTPQAWLEQQLAPTRLPDPEGDTVRRLFPEMGWAIPTARAAGEFNWDGMQALGQGTVALAAWSRRQLLEVMVEFWSNHLNVTNPSDRVWDSRMSYDKTVIRQFALGRFSDLLLASATHPAMLSYLNQADSTKEQPNENYGRELLELHTVGVGAGYSEAEVKSSARILTGWTVGDNGLATYRPDDHWTGPVSVLGFRHANSSADGRAVATAYLRYLATHPKTAQRIARKLAIRFVSDTPPQALVDALAKTYLASGTDIRPVLRRLLLGAEWKTGRKFKTPYEDVISTVRVLGVTLLPATKTVQQRRQGVEPLYWMLDRLRHLPLAWGPPNGYPDVAAAWQAADVTLGRWNAHQGIAAAWWPNRDRLTIPASRSLLPAKLPTTYGGLVDALCDRLLFRRLDTASRNAVLMFCGAGPNTRLDPRSEWLGWRLHYLVALLLDTPIFAERS